MFCPLGRSWKGEDPRIMYTPLRFVPGAGAGRREGSVVIPMIPRLLRSVCSDGGGEVVCPSLLRRTGSLFGMMGLEPP